MTTQPLEQFAKNVYSQNGEDGIVEEILNRLGNSVELTRWCVEFGAWDGVYLSNTCNLIRNRGFSAVMIEGEPDRIKDLERHFPQPDVIKICSFVSLSGNNTLDSILAKTPIPREFDVLSIDIDGCDYWILDSLSEYSFLVLVIEFNPTIPNAISYVQQPDFSIKRGASAKSLVDLGSRKGLSLAAVTSCNLIFVRNEFIETVVTDSQAPPTLEQLRDDSENAVYAFMGYDGTMILSRDLVLPWHGARVNKNSLQPVPLIFRKFPGDWGKFRGVAWRGYRKYKSFRRRFS